MSTATRVEVTVQDLPLTCPMPKASLWNAHPKVSLALDAHGVAHCPYCGTIYQFKGELPQGHH